MCIEFLHSEVVNFLNYNSLFTLNLEDRTITLYEDGLIDEESTELSKKQIFNKEILYSYQISPLIKNIYLESKIKEITGNDIKIIDHPDSEITGISCISCRYIVYENFDDSIFEICPVCYWQTDTLDEQGYSKLNKAYLSNYKNTSSCKEKIKQFKDIYVRK
ncbi:CPCC family cysteine-rich protein [Gilliamella apicola]|uniref:CPCC family cysteine-rich protein n=1 Tax=Gilliamella apicola TaxID=1196095 RepID=UPI0039856C26